MSFIKQILLLMLFGGLSAPASARMYQWIDSATGTVQLSGSAPAWYRNARPGPRVFVFENGRLVDDTARPLPPTAGAMTRPGEETPASAVSEPALDAPLAAAQSPAADTTTSAQIAEFKALIEAYDKAQADLARSALLPPEAPNVTSPSASPTR